MLNILVKYLPIALPIIGLFSLILGILVVKKKGEEAEFRKFTRGGFWAILIVPAFSIIGSIVSAAHDFSEIDAKNQKIKDDSVLLAQRWLHDTIRLRQIIDSSELIIDSTNLVLRTAKVVLKDLSDVKNNVKSDLNNSEAERYPLFPLEIKAEYLLKFKRVMFNERFPHYRLSEMTNKIRPGQDTSSLDVSLGFNSTDATSQQGFGSLTPYFRASKQGFHFINPINSGPEGNFGISFGYGPGLDSTFLELRYSPDSVLVEVTRIFRDVQLHYSFNINDIKGVNDLLGYHLQVCIPHQECIPEIKKVVLSVGDEDRVPRFILKSFKEVADTGGVQFNETIFTKKTLSNVRGYKLGVL